MPARHWLPPEPVAPSGKFLYDIDGRCAETIPSGGLTVIDHFAGVALNGLIVCEQTYHMTAEELAERSFNIAEAMLAERKHRYG